MAKSLLETIRRVIAPKNAAKHPLGKMVEIAFKGHGIERDLIDDSAIDVVQTLQQAGYSAYIVGGAVRDLLLGLRPKDFDVATNAEPEQVKRLFRRAFIIGKRFRIVHVVFGRGREHEVIEVSTFRAYLDASKAQQVRGNEKTAKTALANTQHAVDEHGRVLRDNVWGSQQEDAARRDFTINAMYYDPVRQVVIDYHQGFEDCAKRRLKLIGDPLTRYREDPVRILRAVRFAAKLSPAGFALEKKTAQPLLACKELLEQIPQSRLFDECLKLLQTGHAIQSLAQLELLGLGQGIYPLLDVVVQRSVVPMVQAALLDTDRRISEGKSAAPYFLLACVLWDEVNAYWQSFLANGEHSVPALHAAIDSVFDARIGDVSGRGKLAADMREVWLLQPRFERRSPSSSLRLLDNPRFRAGYDFLRLRASVGEVDVELADWWHELSSAEPEAREELLNSIAKHKTDKSLHDKVHGNGQGDAAHYPPREPSANPRTRGRRPRPPRKPRTPPSAS